MASFEASAERRGKAIDSLTQTMSDLSQWLDVEPVAIPTRAFDAITLQAIQLEALADWAASVAEVVEKKLIEKAGLQARLDELETANAELVSQIEALRKSDSIIANPIRPAAAKKSK